MDAVIVLTLIGIVIGAAALYLQYTKHEQERIERSQDPLHIALEDAAPDARGKGFVRDATLREAFPDGLAIVAVNKSARPVYVTEYGLKPNYGEVWWEQKISDNSGEIPPGGRGRWVIPSHVVHALPSHEAAFGPTPFVRLATGERLSGTEATWPRAPT